MKYSASKPRPVKPGHVRAAEALLAVCKMGMNNPDTGMRVAYAVMADLIEKQRDEWGETGPFGHRTDQPQAAVLAGGVQ